MKPALLPQIASSFSLLDGSKGKNRCLDRLCQIEAKNDWEAICCWLLEYKNSPATFRNYQKEADRLLIWCVLQHQKPLSSLNRMDLEAYFNFLSNPIPAAFWCGHKGPKRGTPAWKPFAGPLGDSAKRASMAILDSLFGYLVDACYLQFNPLSLMRKKLNKNLNQEAQKIQLLERILEPLEWGHLYNTLISLPADTKRAKQEKARLRFLVSILFLLGLRIHELENHTWGHFRQINGLWWFLVQGKGKKLGKVPVNEALLDEIKIFRSALGLPLHPEPGENRPIIPSWLSDKSLSTRQMAYLLKNLALKAAETCQNPQSIQKLKAFSPHWLRHLSASMQDLAGIPFGHIKANHRHENEETTRRYVHAIDQQRHEQMNKLKLPI